MIERKQSSSEKNKGRPRRKRFVLNRGYPFTFYSPHTIEICVGRLRARPEKVDRVVVKQRDADHYVFRVRRVNGRLFVEVCGVLARVGQETHVTGLALINGSTLMFIWLILIIGAVLVFTGDDPDGRIAIGTLAAAAVFYFWADSARYRFYEDVIKMLDGREQSGDGTGQRKQ